jgi:transcriptional regulator, TetR family
MADTRTDAVNDNTATRTRSRPEVRVTPRGEDRRQAIIDAAAAIIRESGPSAVSHRSVAKRAGCSLSATTYYFDGLEDLLHQAGLVNIGLWASRAERVADRVEAFKGVPDLSQRVRFILQATLPAHGGYFGHYLQLISASQAAPVKQAYRQGRQRLNVALRRVLRQLDSPLEPEMVIAVVDGAAVTALSEGWNVKSTAAGLLTDLISLAHGMPSFQVPGAAVGAAAANATLPAAVKASSSTR